jgi:hypothetical protein
MKYPDLEKVLDVLLETARAEVLETFDRPSHPEDIARRAADAITSAGVALHMWAEVDKQSGSTVKLHSDKLSAVDYYSFGNSGYGQQFPSGG